MRLSDKGRVLSARFVFSLSVVVMQDQSNMKMCHVWVIYQICFNVHPKLDCNDGGPIGTRFFKI